LRAAAIIAERDQQRLPLRGAFGGAATELLVLVLQALERIALLVDLPAQTAALRRRNVEDREKAGTFTAAAARLRDQPVDLELLAVDRVLGAADLVGARRIAVAAVERRKLGFQPLAGRVLRLRKRADARRQRRHRYGCKLENASPHDRHSNAKIMAVRASCLMRSRSLCTQIPQHAGDDDQGAEQHE
jgi:hypothetical protein